MDKSALRQQFLRKRSELSVSAAAQAGHLIAERFFELPELAVIDTLHTFIRLKKFNEIDTSIIYFKLWRDHERIRTCAPRVDHSTEMIESVLFDEDTDLIEDRWGIREPAFGDIVDPKDVDMVLVPMLCFDVFGHRVGYGKGFYDRFLNQCRPDCRKVGLSYWPPIDGPIETHDGDIRLDTCITPRETFRLDPCSHQMKKASEDASFIEIFSEQ